MPNRGGFSWKRFIGITRVKQNIARKTGIPLTKSGRQRKIGAMLTKSCGCSSIIMVASVILLAIIIIIISPIFRTLV